MSVQVFEGDGEDRDFGVPGEQFFYMVQTETRPKDRWRVGVVTPWTEQLDKPHARAMLKGIGMRRPEINKLLNEARSREIERYERNANKHKARTSAVATQWHQRILVSVQATRRLEL